jgi:hypothetical protein
VTCERFVPTLKKCGLLANAVGFVYCEVCFIDLRREKTMLQEDQAILAKAYQMFKEGKELNEAIAESIGQKQLPVSRISNMCTLANQMVNSRNRQDGKHAQRFKIARTEDVVSKLSSYEGETSHGEKSNLSDYRKMYKTTPKTSSNTEFNGVGSFRDIVDLHRKLASAKTFLENESGKASKEYERAEYKLISAIKTAHATGNSVLEIESALVSCNPQYSSVALAFCKSACDSMIATGKMAREEFEKFVSFPHDLLIKKLACDPLSLEESELKTSFDNFVLAMSRKKEIKQKLCLASDALVKASAAKDLSSLYS